MDEEQLGRITAVRMLVDQVTRTAMLVPLEDANGLVQLENHMETVLPFVDPTAYMNNQSNMRIRDKQFRAFLDFRTQLEKIKDGI